MANPQLYTLSTDVEKVFTLDANYAWVRVTIVAQSATPAVVFFNTKDVAVPTAAGAIATLDGNEALPPVLCSATVRDETAGAVSKVRMRSVGAVTVSVRGL